VTFRGASSVPIAPPTTTAQVQQKQALRTGRVRPVRPRRPACYLVVATPLDFSIAVITPFVGSKNFVVTAGQPPSEPW
jgi:hypothetical protein